MNTVFFLLGANLGDPLKQLQEAVREMEARVGSIKQLSRIYESEAWGVTDQPTFLNLVTEVETHFDAIRTLQIIQSIEQDLGRIRLSRWGARLIDIDILYFNDEIIDLENLNVPHPYIQDRRFTLVPLCDLAPDYIHPFLQKNNQTLLEQCIDPLDVKLHSKQPYV
ncbi:2-amino-4-hydroxy-6-hydroxymethyldihydropteridine diphosphokinase [Sphingobacterium wenxiniae]|uniref:2-amino-4-hydroxy-6-hydroxymethyldihydropteridine pyrophosphokinase n=1 Tax=Sphingobacterium wenxiniae TaxID=683125 RepID=A0A1I6V2Z2_9SPHI|nr:2-amino-4-hydroxy-6-hydroxymethyldihydropteridine diphosphokinase [Sphingobacterium wenxiniae]SFT08069.1 2-amino-4-hydroxy-6-hydroxymethyldihydropteridinediphosphokinase [Sphingobacterium wenxiniae]